MSETKIPFDKMRRALVLHRGEQTMQPHYRGTEIGTQDDVELQGFKKDYVRFILDPVMEKFPHGATPSALSEFLHKQVATTPVDGSAGPYLRASVAEIDEILSKQFGFTPKTAPVSTAQKSASSDPLDNATAQHAFEALGEKFKGDTEARKILDEAWNKLRSQLKPNATAKDFAIALEDGGDEYDRKGSAPLADKADQMRMQLRGLVSSATPKTFAPTPVRRV